MHRILLSLFLILSLTTGATSALASGKAPAEKPATETAATATTTDPQAPAAPVSAEELGKLTETLKDPKEREKFLSNLETLSAVKAEDAIQEPPPLSEAIGLDQKTKSFFEKYQAFLKDNALSDTRIGQIGASALAIFSAIALFFLVRFVTGRFGLWSGRMRRRFGIEGRRFSFYTRLLRLAGYLLIVALLAYSLATIWEFTNFGFMKTDLALRLFSGVLNLLLVSVLGIALWETVSGTIERALRRADEQGATRIKTLLPLLHTILLFLFSAIFGLLLLSELGVNIVPFMAGAGVLGIAVGFGAQTMVKDFLTGFTIILEDLIQVGDVVRVAGYSGVVEKITIRKVQLRDMAGTVYTVPFSDITTVENLTKDFSFYVMNIGVSYSENLDTVVACLKEIDEELRADPDYGQFILEPLDILGLDQFGDSAVVIKARIKTKPVKQWFVGREFNRRMKLAFDAKGIEIPFPHRTIYVRQEGAPATGPDGDKATASAITALGGG